MHSKSDNIEIMVYDKVVEILDLNRYDIRLQTSMRGADFIFDCVNLLHYKCPKINLKRGGS